MIKQAPSALVAIGGFGVAVATLSVATTAAIVILAPQPPALRTSAADMIAALHRPMPGFERRFIAAPPQGQRMTMLEGLIAVELRRPPRDASHGEHSRGNRRNLEAVRHRAASIVVRSGPTRKWPI
jgi:two-component system OmpR family sensor kinase